ncbi:MAG: hypothetical protein ACRDZQ_13830 [Acidimicrobiales bacterium]
MSTASPRHRGRNGSSGGRLVVHPARHLPMDDHRRARVVSALTALLIPYLRDRRGGVALDSGRPVEPSSEPPHR